MRMIESLLVQNMILFDFMFEELHFLDCTIARCISLLTFWMINQKIDSIS